MVEAVSTAMELFVQASLALAGTEVGTVSIVVLEQAILR